MAVAHTPAARVHGSPYDRGSADAYYGRPFAPHYYRGPVSHYFVGGTSQSPRITDLTPAQIADYRAGWDACIESGDRKDWG